MEFERSVAQLRGVSGKSVRVMNSHFVWVYLGLSILRYYFDLRLFSAELQQDKIDASKKDRQRDRRKNFTVHFSLPFLFRHVTFSNSDNMNYPLVCKTPVA